MANALHWKTVSIHPYFKAHRGELENCKNLLRAFVEKTGSEHGCRFYEFTLNGDEIFCREAYSDAEAALRHLENVGEELAALLKIVDLTRLEIHGTEGEIDKLKGPLAHLNPQWFIWECGLER